MPRCPQDAVAVGGRRRRRSLGLGGGADPPGRRAGSRRHQRVLEGHAGARASPAQPTRGPSSSVPTPDDRGTTDITVAVVKRPDGKDGSGFRLNSRCQRRYLLQPLRHPGGKLAAMAGTGRTHPPIDSARPLASGSCANSDAGSDRSSPALTGGVSALVVRPTQTNQVLGEQAAANRSEAASHHTRNTFITSSARWLMTSPRWARTSASRTASTCRYCAWPQRPRSRLSAW